MKSRLLMRPLLCFVGYSARALAQEAPPPPAPPSEGPPIQLVQPQTPPAAHRPTIDLNTEAPAKPVQRTYHVHEGFYLRGSVSFGYYYGSFSDADQPNLDSGENAGSMALDLLIGGSPSPGVSLGAGLMVDPLFGSDGRGRFSSLIGPFVDGFPDPTKGWHLGALIGFAGQSFDSLDGTNDGAARRATGIGGAAWFGYDYWVGSEWAVGPQFRVMGARTKDSRDDQVTGFVSSFDLGMSVVFN